MLKALKVAMIVYGILGILFGLAYIFIPQELSEMFGYQQEGPEYMVGYLSAFSVALGTSFIAICVFLIAAARDPIRHIYWVKFAILFAVLMLVAELYSALRGYVEFSEATMGIVIHAVFAAAFLIFYPWRGAREA